METITINNPETRSADILADNIERLKVLFPEAWTEGKIDFEVLKQLLGCIVDECEEKYGLNWHGKRRARQQALTPSTGTLRPCPEDSVEWDTTQNLMIEGDNLEVLKLLQKSYAGKVKLIYIDPPYNTGKDFVYPDNFQDNIKNYLELTGQIESGRKMSSNTEANGRFHTDWLNMIYSRIHLSRNLLRDDGVIFISISDVEHSNLKKACDEIFGETNFLGCACRVSKKANNQGDFWAPNFDYILTYAKDRLKCPGFFGGVNFEAYNQVDSIGPRAGEKYQLVRLYMTSLDPMRGCTNQRYYIEAPDGTLLIPPGNVFPEEKINGASISPQGVDDKIWRWTKDKYFAEQDKIVVKRVRSSNLVDSEGKEVQWNVFTKTYLNDVIKNNTAKPNSLIDDHINQNSSHELNELEIPFSFAKPSSLIKFLCEISHTQNEDIILDFFAGSGTTGDAVMALNATDGGNRRYILVQLPEPLDSDDKDQKTATEFCDQLSKPRNIAELTKERLRRAAKKIKDENPTFTGDLGFRIFKLDSSNIRTWDPDYANFENTLLEHIDHIKAERSEQDVLYELLLKLGLDLCVPIKTHTIVGKTVHSIGAGALIVCLDDEVSQLAVEPLALGIAAWHEDLAPVSGSTIIFRDSAFANDVAKANLVAILEQHGLENVRSL